MVWKKFIAMLQENNIVLRRLADNDQAVLASLANNKRIWNNLRDVLPHPYTDADAAAFIALTQNEEPQTTFAIVYKDQFCGVIGLVRQSDVYRLTAEIGYWLGEPFWNKGIATTAVALITEYGFNTLNLVRIHAGIFEFNTGSMRVLEKAGYEKDGIFKKSVFKNGKIWAEHRYSKTV